MTTPKTPKAVKPIGKDEVLSLLKAPAKAASQNSITFWSGGWSLLELRGMNPNLFFDQSWYDNEEFATVKHPEGTYTVNLDVANSRNKTFQEQKRLLKGDEVIPPIAVVATAALLLFLQTGRYPLSDYYVRCAEKDSVGYRVYVGHFDANGLHVSYYWDAHCTSPFGLAASRKVPDA